MHNYSTATDTSLCHTTAAVHMPVAKCSGMVLPQTANHISKGLNFWYFFWYYMASSVGNHKLKSSARECCGLKSVHLLHNGFTDVYIE